MPFFFFFFPFLPECVFLNRMFVSSFLSGMATSFCIAPPVPSAWPTWPVATCTGSMTRAQSCLGALWCYPLAACSLPSTGTPSVCACVCVHMCGCMRLLALGERVWMGKLEVKLIVRVCIWFWASAFLGSLAPPDPEHSNSELILVWSDTVQKSSCHVFSFPKHHQSES